MVPAATSLQVVVKAISIMRRATGPGWSLENTKCLRWVSRGGMRLPRHMDRKIKEESRG
jgi:hypothetical protein